MDFLWNNASSFNDMSLTFSKLTYNDIKDFPARVRVTYHTRNDHTGILDDCGVEKILLINCLNLTHSNPNVMTHT